MLEDLYVRRDELKNELKDCDNALERMRLVETIERINKVLEDPRKAIDDGPVYTGDPIVDQWERDIAEGRRPDLTVGMSPNSPLLRPRRR
jgi:hypothetical protein